MVNITDPKFDDPRPSGPGSIDPPPDEERPYFVCQFHCASGALCTHLFRQRLEARLARLAVEFDA